MKVAIIGGGLAGLAAACWLAEAGASVQVWERSQHCGGRARSQKLAESWMNLGPHALYRGGHAAAALRSLGVSWSGAAPDVAGVVSYGGALHTMPAGPMSMARTTLWGWRGAAAAAGILARISWMNLDNIQDITMASWMEENITDPAVAALISGLVRVSTYCDAPEHLSAGAGLAQVRQALVSGVEYLDGGWQTLVVGLQDRAEAAGVELHTGSRVEALRWQGGRPSAVVVRGEEVAVDAVIFACDPATVSALLGSRSPELSGLVPARAACMDVVLDGLPQPAPRFALGLDEPFYFSVHSGAADLGPHTVAHIARYLAPGASCEVDWLEGHLDRLQPGWRERVLHRRFLPALTVSHGIPTAAAPRPSPLLMDGVGLAGDWVGGEGMLLDAALASARCAVDGLLAGMREAA